MYGHLMCLAAAALGIDVGWQRLPEGGVQYLIQIGPETLESLKAGQAIESDIPPTVKDIRGYRITVGNKQLPREVVTSDTQSPTGPSNFGFSRAAPSSPMGTAPMSGPPMGSAPIAGTPPGAYAWPSSPSPAPFTPMPQTLSSEPPGKPLAERQASFLEATPPAPPKAEGKATTAVTVEPAPPTSSHAWTYLTGSLVALSGSLAWNGYLLWMLREARRRYRKLLERTGTTEEEYQEEYEEEEAEDTKERKK
jgi:hypothetical protein